MSSDQVSFRRMTSQSSRLIESSCANCGVFIAATPSTRLLESLENLHHCPSSSEEAMTRDRLADLLRELSRRESDLLEWISRSEENRHWFATDPMAAIRAADLGIDDRILLQLELITRSIARKLRRL